MGSIAKQYLDAGKNLTLLSGKRPILDGWTEITLDEDRILSHKGNLGWVIGDGDLVVDVDPKNGGEDSFNKMLDDVLVTEQDLLRMSPTVRTPSGGFHIYLKLPNSCNGARFRKTLNKIYPGIDFLTKGSQCVIPGSKTDKGEYRWEDDLFGEFYQVNAPQRLIDLIRVDDSMVNKPAEQGLDDLGDFEGIIGGKSSTWSEQRVLEMLDSLDASMDNNEWVKVGMALHDWDPVDGLRLWEQWSLSGDNYEEGQTEKRWRSFDIGGGVTLGSISYMCKEIDYDLSAERVEKYLRIIKKSDAKGLQFDLAPKLKKESFSDINKEIIVKCFQDRFKELTSVKLPISQIRTMLMDKSKFADGQLVDNEDLDVPEWCKHWVYVNSHSAFMDLNTLVLHKSESFNIENGKQVPPNESGSKVSAAKFVADSGFINQVHALAYLPTHDEAICSIDGLRVLNCFSPKSVPEEATEHTPEGLEAIEVVKRHIKFICGNSKDADIFTQWLAHQVQFPGRQVLWSPVIQSVQGVGKSFFGELLRACLGDRNVGTVSPGQVVSDFNGWATNVVVNILEELRVKGHNRYDAVNALKPLITDRMIQVNDKGVKQYMTYNTTNYMCFTNYKDALPLDGHDRRWWVIYAPIDSLSNMRKFVGEDAVTYFPKLFKAVNNNPTEMRKWLLEYKISQSFIDIKQAPMTDHKKSMIETEEAAFEGLYEIKELIKKGGKYFNEQVVCSVDLFDAMIFDYPEIEIPRNKRHLILKKLGYTIASNSIKIDGKVRKVWSKSTMSNAVIREALISEDL
jgi:hypothetical protein